MRFSRFQRSISCWVANSPGHNDFQSFPRSDMVDGTAAGHRGVDAVSQATVDPITVAARRARWSDWTRPRATVPPMGER